MIELNAAELLARLRNFEDNFVERKTSGDDKYDWVKTAVAFANSAPVDYPCVLYIGVRDNGDIEERQVNLDSLQKTFNKEMRAVYPPIAYLLRIIESEGRQALAVIVLGSVSRPHFAGPSYVRHGSETRVASEEQFTELIASRNSKTTMLLSYKDKEVTVSNVRRLSTMTDESWWSPDPKVDGCNQFYVTFRQGKLFQSVPLSRVEILFDHEKDRLRLQIMVP